MNQNLLELIISELKKEKICPENIDTSIVKVYLDKIDPSVAENFSSKIVLMIIGHLKNILADNKIDLSDTSEILKLLKDLYIAAGELQNDQKKQITSQQLVDTVMNIINIVISLCMEDKNKAFLLVKIIETSGTFLLISLPEKISCKCC